MFAIFLVFITACEKNQEDVIPTNSATHEASDLLTTALLSEERFTGETTLHNKELATQSVMEYVSESSKYSEQNSSPAIIFATLSDLVRIKSILNTIHPDDFAKYIRENELDFAMNGMGDYESTTKLMNELENTYIPLLDNDKANFSTISFYWERNEIQQITFFDEERRVVCYIYTPESGRETGGRFGENENAIFVKSTKNNLAEADVYRIGDKEYFCVDVLIEDTYIFMRTNKIINIEEFEECFNRLTFVKIGDLLNE